MDKLRSLLSNTKFLAVVTNVVVGAATYFGLGLTAGQVAAVLAAVTSLVVGHAVDQTKQAAAVAKDIQDAAPPTLDADARLAALESWVRANAARLGAGAVPPVPAARPAGKP